MSSRLNILAKIKAHKPDLIELPSIDHELFSEKTALTDTFQKSVEVVGGGSFIANSNAAVLTSVTEMFSDAPKKFSNLNSSENFNTIKIDGTEKPQEFEDLDVLVLNGAFGVAENGAVWLSDSQIPLRVLPFITKQLVLVIKAADIVENMHAAYDRISTSNSEFGVFISGPSKTADIEQSLVIGAQGAMSLTVYILEP